MKHILFVMLISLMLSDIAGASDLIEHCRQVLADKFPHIQAERITVSPEPHFCEIEAGGNILYLNPEQQFFLFGDLVDFDGRNLTAEARQRIVAEKVAALPLENSLKFGKGKERVIIFVDPDCPGCKRLEKFLLSPDILENISLHVFLFPLEKIHPDSRKHCLEVLGADNPREKILELTESSGEVKEKDPSISSQCRPKAEKQLAAMIDAGQGFQVRGTPTVIINNRILGGNVLQISRELLRLADLSAKDTGPGNNPNEKE
jgi:thiol:disulfide interchange protein DsbC